MNQFDWSVMKTKPRHEFVVSRDLEAREVEYFLPTLGGKIPLFPNYVFVKPTRAQMAGMLWIRGSRGLLLKNGNPGVLRDEEIRSIRLLLENRKDIRIGDRFVLGQRVKVIKGPIAGVIGEYVKMKNENRLILNADIIGQHISIEINVTDIVPI
jgi:transcriptional antiterminator NusG